MPLEVMIPVPGLLTVTYPFINQTLTSHVRLGGNIIIRSNELPEGQQYIIDNLPAGVNPALVLPSHGLQGKDYMIGIVSYYIDGTLYREVDFTEDETNAYQFGNDYLPVYFAGEELSPGKHELTIQVTAFSFENPGVEIFDAVVIPFRYDQSAVSIFEYMQAITPQPYLGELDWNVMMRSYDYILTQRSEGALKADIDFIGSLYDVDNIPDTLIPYLAKTIGYEYFSGIASRGQEAVRQELRFLPDWQKSVGTEESILVLLRSLSLEAELTPLYLDLQQNILVPGVNRYYRAEDADMIRPGLRTRRYFTPFTHHNFRPETVVTTFSVGGVSVLEILWSTTKGEPVIVHYDPLNGWLDAPFTSPEPTNAQELRDSGIIERIDVSNQRGGLTLFFSELVGINDRVRVNTTYQIERNTRPGRNHRLSEFFDVDIIDRSPPNVLTAEDFQRVYNIVLRSKPLRTKLRTMGFPINMADIYHVNSTSVSTTGNLGNLDILEANNIKPQGVNLRFPMRESVGFTLYNRFLEGFTFTWEDECDRWENRFGIFHALAIEPSLHSEDVLHVIQTDPLSRRGYAVRVEDDSLDRIPDDDIQERLLRCLGLELKNFKGGNVRCVTREDLEVYYHKFFLALEDDGSQPGSPCPDPTSPVPPYVSPYASPAMSPGVPDCFRLLNTAVVEMDSPDEITPGNKVVHHFKVLDTENPGQFVQANVTFEGGQTVLVEWEGFGPPTTETMTPIPASSLVNLPKSSLDWYLVLTHPTKQQIQIVLRFTAFETEENVQYLYATEPNYNNMPFRAGGSPFWYAFATVITDPWRFPVQWTATYDSVLTNCQDMTCCEEVGTVSDGNVFTFNETLGLSYLYGPGSIELVAIEDSTGDIHDRLTWNGEYWVVAKKKSPLVWNMLSTGNSGDNWEPVVLNPVQIQGTATYPTQVMDPGVQASTYTFKLCTKRVGERMKMSLNTVLTEHWSLGRLHRGEYSPYDRQDTFYGGQKAQDLIDLQHNKFIDAAAMDDFYFRADDGQTTPQIHPSLRYTLTPPVPIDQLQWDNDPFDGAFAWDSAPAGALHLHINHFPRKVIYETAETFDITNVVATVPD